MHIEHPRCVGLGVQGFKGRTLAIPGGVSGGHVNGHIAWFAAPPAQGDAVAFGGAHDLLTLVSQFKAEGDFLHYRVPVEIEDDIFGDDL